MPTWLNLWFAKLTTLPTSVSRSKQILQAEGWEQLFHDWLSHVLHRFLQDGFIAATIAILEIDEHRVHARLTGEKLDYDRHEFETEIKAVTYHQLSVTCEQ